MIISVCIENNTYGILCGVVKEYPLFAYIIEWGIKMIQIEIGNVTETTNTTAKGRVLEHLVADLLKIQQYDVVETIRVTGMELDVFAKHKINNEKLIVECKAWEGSLPAGSSGFRSLGE